VIATLRRSGPPVTSAPPELPPRAECSDAQFDQWVRAVTERADPFMAWLGAMFALTVGFDIAAQPSGGTATALEVVGWTIWAIFAIELAAKLRLAPHRLRYLRRHWWQPILLLVPFLRVLSFLRLVRVGRALPASRVISSSYRAVGTGRYLLGSRLGYLGAISSVSAIAVAELAYLFERDVEGGAFDSFGDALLWGVTAVVALQADPVPTTVGARIVMVLALIIGLVVVASLAGVIGTFLVDERRERASADEGP
jgi:voltage-gated potassium channel